MTSSTCVLASKYKINTSGKVTSPSGTVQAPTQYYNQPVTPYKNYTADGYAQSNQVNQTAVSTINIVMDFSGSMTNWVTKAKNTMGLILQQVPSSVKIGFRVFGQNGGSNPHQPIISAVRKIAKKDDGKYDISAKKASFFGSTIGGCSSTESIVPVVQKDATILTQKMNSVRIGGATPLTLALYNAANADFNSFSRHTPKKIILITDGGESCGGDPCAFAQDLMSKRSDIHIDVVLVSSNSKKLLCLTRTTGGNFYHVDDLSSFPQVITESMTSKPTQPEAPSESQNGQHFEFLK